VPTKLPGPQIFEPDDLIPPVTLDDILPVPVKYQPLIDALHRNSKIDVLTPCSHPLAKWNLSFTEDPTYWSRRNYLHDRDEPETDRFVKEMLAAGNISVAPPNSKLCFSLLAVNKKDDSGNITGRRTCIDLSPINGILHDDLYPIPLLQEVLACTMKHLGPNSYRNHIDCTAAYHRFEIVQKIICFKWKHVLYVLNRAFFGGKTMPAAYQRVADAIIYELKMEEELGAYFDDMLSSDPSLQLSLERAVIIVDTLTRYGIIVNQKKSYFGMHSIPALGFIVDGNGKHLHPAKTAKIRNIEYPKTSTQMKSFLGLCNFIRDSLKHWSILTAVLERILTQGYPRYTQNKRCF
jgi:hypothetical protein